MGDGDVGLDVDARKSIEAAPQNPLANIHKSATDLLFTTMDLPLEPIAFLGRSPNRVEVLKTLDNDPRSRQQLRDELSISRTTLARILNEFEEREWITRQGNEYTTTRASEAIMAKFDPLLETVRGIENLGEAIHWLPPPAHEVDLQHFKDATITTTHDGNPSAPFDRAYELICTADRYHGVTNTAIPRYVETLLDRYNQGELDYEGVIAGEFIQTLEDPDRVATWENSAATGLTWVYDDPMPISMHIVDRTVLIWLGKFTEGGLEVYGVLESSNDAVLSWAESLFEEYRAEAELLEPSMIPAP